MKKRFVPAALMAVTLLALAGCGNKESQLAIDQATKLDSQGEYQKANSVLVDALRAREAKIRASTGTPADAAALKALTDKIQADPDILKMERAQIVIYLHMERADLASAIYSDILEGNPADKVIYETLRNKDPKIRTGAISILGIAGKAETLPALIEAAKDENQEVRRAAIASLGMSKDPQAFAPLMAALKDPYWFTRSAAADGLRQQRNPKAIKDLLNLVADPDPTVEGSAEKALMILCQEPGAAADDFAARLNDPNPKVQLLSAICLAQMKDTRVLPYLRKWLNDPDVDARGWSIIGLGKLMDTDSLPALRAIAANPQELPNIRTAANAAANHIEGKTPPPPASAP